MSWTVLITIMNINAGISPSGSPQRSHRYTEYVRSRALAQDGDEIRIKRQAIGSIQP
jgi:hypothetical protein